MAKAQDQLLVLMTQADRFRNHGCGAVAAGQKPAQARMKPAFAGGQVTLQKRQRKFDGDELMALAAAAASGQGSIVLRVETGRQGSKLERRARRANFSVAGDVEANLQTARMKRFGPIQGPRRGKIVPFDAVAGVTETAVEFAPAVAEGLPSIRFAEGQSVARA